MSVAGSRSWQGDEFQLRIALSYLIRVLANELVGLQVESTGVPGKDFAISVDDVVALLPDDKREYVQAKKNQPNHESWTLKDRGLREELKKVRDQLEADPSGTVRFFSRSPFGDLRKLQEEAQLCPDESAFTRTAGRAVHTTLTELASLLDRTVSVTFLLLRRIGFGPTRELEDWDNENKRDIDRFMPSGATALKVLERFLSAHHGHLRDSKFVITREDVLHELARHALVPAPVYEEKETLNQFLRAGQIGRSWPRDVAGRKLQRPELDAVLSHIRARVKTVLVAAGPGSGKTCLLLDVADELERDGSTGVLFIRGDRFAGVEEEARLQDNGLPSDIVGRCARLAVARRVVVLLDSLDVLSISRNHGALRVFLALLERLEKVDGVTVVAACREFDLSYDPQLRARKWQARVPLGLLGYADVVAPILREWGADPAAMSDDARNLLSVPQHLRLFHRLTKDGRTPDLVSSYQLYELFIDEAVTRNPGLGDAALRKLEDLAASGVHQRRQTFPRASLDLSSAMVHQLISSEILLEDEARRLTFAHQTIAESLAVRKGLREGQTLAKFVLEEPPLPFVRPTVRAFFFSLRGQDGKIFRRQVWEALGHPDVAYHLKRLVAESLAETRPEDADWPLVGRLYRQQPTLFKRTLAQARNDAWFELLRRHWLPILKQPGTAAEWRYQYIGALQRWVKSRPRQVIELWIEALETGWAPDGSAWRIATALSDLADWSSAGVHKLFTLLIAKGAGLEVLGRPLRAWISATGSGDGILWRCMTAGDTINGEEEAEDELRHAPKVPHDFQDSGFLLQRLERSDDLLTQTAEYLAARSSGTDEGRRFSIATLRNTSWHRRHSRHSMLPAHGSTVLVQAFEHALKTRARENDDWWRGHEPGFRHSTNLGIRYALINAYAENPLENVTGIEAQLVHADLFRGGQLEHELGRLMADTYGYLSEDAQDRNQEMLLHLYDDYLDDSGGLSKWAVKEIYQYLVWIPRPFRAPRTAAFMALWQEDCDAVRATPRIHSWGGPVESPISRDQLVDLDSASIIRILRHYAGDEARETELLEHGRLVGGLHQVQSTVRESAALQPSRFLKTMSEDFDDELRLSFGPAIYGGIAEHLRYATGSLAVPDGWNRHGEALTPEDLASELLRFAECTLLGSRSLSSDLEYAVSRALQAVADTTEVEETGERMSLALWRMVNSQDPEPQPEQGAFDLGMVSLNSTRGVLAGTAMSLVCRWLQLKKPVPRLLPPLLKRFASDPALGVRVSILNKLAFLIHGDPVLGWALLDSVFRESQDQLWLEAEPVLYYNYRHAFARVEPLLRRIRNEAPDVAGETYGRISCLSHLADHVVNDGQPLLMLATTASIRHGIAGVLCANLSDPSLTAKCRTSLVEMLQSSEHAESAAVALSHHMANENNDSAVDPDLVLACVRALTTSGGSNSTWGLCKWLERNCGRYPLVALEACEALAALAEAHAEIRFSPELVPVLLEMLREADEIDDPALIARVVGLQDNLLRLGVQGVDELLDKAASS